MFKKIMLIAICFMSLQYSFSQENINNYKYVIVPNKYEFLKEADQYKLNSLSKFLFEKYGFTALMQDSEYPQDLLDDMCSALRADVIDDSKLFRTKLKVIFKNCQDRVVFESNLGESNDKQYKVAYNQALREAFMSVEALNYKYEPSSSAPKAVTATTAVAVNTVPTKQEPKQDVVSTSNTSINEVISYEMLYAQKIEGGYQLVDSTPKVVMILLETPKPDMFLVKGKDAVVYKSDDEWILADKTAGETRSTTLVIKF